jgi:cyclic pyranopterin phosphate synthase
MLTAEEIERVAQAAVRLGFHKFRLTGGEPTLRADLVDIVERLAAIDGVRDLAMTTNGILLPDLAQPLRAAGLRRVNIHLDTLNPDRLKRLMRFGSVDQILAGLEAAVAAGLTPLKINCVVTLGYNDADVVDLARLTMEHDWQVRFIELMPLGGGQCASWP